MILPLALFASSILGGEGVTSKLIATGATAKVGGYRPIRADFAAPGADFKPNITVVSPKVGKFTFGSKTVGFIIDDVDANTSKIYVDANGDGDYSNDPAAEWQPRKQGNATMYFGGANVDAGKGTPVGIKFYRFDPNDPQRAALKSTLLYYTDFGYEVTLTLDGKPFTSFVGGEPSKDSSLTIDRNGDGQISYKRESIAVDQPFNFTGTTYVLSVAEGGFKLAKAPAKLPVSPLPPDLGIGKKAIPFVADTLDGKRVSFPRDYKGKLVMLDFWATWCGPCIAELPNVKKAYEKWNKEGYEILSISFDQKDKANEVRDFAEKNGMSWRHVYEGAFWDTKLGNLYDVSGIPFVLLVDGDTGQILATENELRGPGLVDTIEKALAKKKGKK
ncbi:MAG: TlpA family protein disulfide reductase [Fimbriimonas sp.]